MIEYQMVPGMTPEQKTNGDLVAQSSTALRIDEDTLFNEITRQGTTARKADVQAVLANISSAVAALCARGESVTIPGLGIVTPRVSGVMNAQREWIKGPEAYMTIRFDGTLQAAFQSNVQIKEIPAATIRPIIATISDAASGTANAILTVGGMVGLRGNNLKFHPLAGDEGVYIVPQDGTQAIKCTCYLDNRTTYLSFTVPAGLASGTSCKIEVRARRGKCKTLRASDCATLLTITE